MTGPEIMGVVVFFLVVLGAIAGFWWRVEGKVKGAEDKAETALTKLADHKVHVAETYISKQGHRESTDQILEAINRVNDRLDRAFEPKRRAGS